MLPSLRYTRMQPRRRYPDGISLLGTSFLSVCVVPNEVMDPYPLTPVSIPVPSGSNVATAAGTSFRFIMELFLITCGAVNQAVESNRGRLEMPSAQDVVDSAIQEYRLQRPDADAQYAARPDSPRAAGADEYDASVRAAVQRMAPAHVRAPAAGVGGGGGDDHDDLHAALDEYDAMLLDDGDDGDDSEDDGDDDAALRRILGIDEAGSGGGGGGGAGNRPSAGAGMPAEDDETRSLRARLPAEHRDRLVIPAEPCSVFAQRTEHYHIFILASFQQNLDADYVYRILDSMYGSIEREDEVRASTRPRRRFGGGGGDDHDDYDDHDGADEAGGADEDLPPDERLLDPNSPAVRRRNARRRSNKEVKRIITRNDTGVARDAYRRYFGLSVGANRSPGALPVDFLNLHGAIGAIVAHGVMPLRQWIRGSSREVQQLVRLVKGGGLPTDLALRGDFYELPLAEFAHTAMHQRILPWIDPSVTAFLMQGQPGSDAAAAAINGPQVTERLAKALQDGDRLPGQEETQPDPIGMLRRYHDAVRARHDGRMPPDEQKLAIERFACLLGSSRLRRYMSPAIRAHLNYADRMRHPEDRDVVRVGGLVRPMRGMGALSTYQMFVANVAEHYIGIANQNLDTFLLGDLIMDSALDLTDSLCIHFAGVGEAQAGKSHTGDRLLGCRIDDTYSVLTMQSSDKSGTTGIPETCGVHFYGEMPLYMVIRERNLSNQDRAILTAKKEELSSGRTVYKVFEFVEDPNTGEKRRTFRVIATRREIAIFGFCNELSNGEEAMGTRFVHKTIAKARGAEMNSMVFREQRLRELKPYVEAIKDVMRSKQILVFFIFMAINAGVIGPIETSVAATCAWKFTSALVQNGVPHANNARDMMRIIQLARTLTVVRAAVINYFTPEGKYYGKGFRLEHLAHLQYWLWTSVETVTLATSFLAEQYFDPLANSITAHLFQKYANVTRDELIPPEDGGRREVDMEDLMPSPPPPPPPSAGGRGEADMEDDEADAEERGGFTGDEMDQDSGVDDDEADDDDDDDVLSDDLSDYSREARRSRRDAAATPYRDGGDEPGAPDNYGGDDDDDDDSAAFPGIYDDEERETLLVSYRILDRMLEICAEGRVGFAEDRVGDGAGVGVGRQRPPAFPDAYAGHAGGGGGGGGGGGMLGERNGRLHHHHHHHHHHGMPRFGAPGGGGDYGGAPAAAAPSTVDLNYLCVSLGFPRLRDLYDDIQRNMKAMPPGSAIESIVQNLIRRQHRVPVWFKKLTVAAFQELLKMYMVDSDRYVAARGARVVALTERVGYTRNALHVLVRIDDDVHNRNNKFLLISPHLFLHDDGSIIERVVRECTQFRGTQKRTLFVPIMNKSFQYDVKGRFQMMTLLPNPNLDAFEWENPSYVDLGARSIVESAAIASVQQIHGREAWDERIRRVRDQLGAAGIVDSMDDLDEYRFIRDLAKERIISEKMIRVDVDLDEWSFERSIAAIGAEPYDYVMDGFKEAFHMTEAEIEAERAGRAEVIEERRVLALRRQQESYAELMRETARLASGPAPASSSSSSSSRERPRRRARDESGGTQEPRRRRRPRRD